MKYLAFAVFGILLLGCRKEEEHVPYYPVSPEQTAFYNYQTGSYWIMEDVNTHVRDSFAVINYVTSSTKTSSDMRDEIVVVIRDFPLGRTADTATWYVDLRDHQQVSMLYQPKPESWTRAEFPALLSPPKSPNKPTYEQGGKQFENAYETNRVSVSYNALLEPDTTGTLLTVFNSEAGLVRLKASIGPDYHYDWQLVESKIVR